MNLSRLGPQAAQGWKRYAAESGASLSALGEAVGRLLLRAGEHGETSLDLAELGTLAREIAADRRGLNS